MKRLKWIGVVAVGCGFAALLAVRVAALRYPTTYLADEQVYVDTARAIVSGGGYRFDHPGLFPLLIAGAIASFGDHPWAWRLPALVITAALPALAYGLVRLGGIRRRYAIAVALLVAADPFLGMYSRAALPDGIIATLVLAALYLSLLEQEWEWGRVALVGAIVGLAAATKYNGAWIVAVPIILLIGRRAWLQAAGLLGIAGATYLAVTACVVALAGGWGSALPQAWLAWQRYSISFHVHQASPYWYASRWYTWPFGLVPVTFWRQALDGDIRTVEAVPNLLQLGIIGLGMTWSVGEGVWRLVTRRGFAGARRLLPIMPLAYLCLFLPWAAISRPGFLYHYLGAYLVGSVGAWMLLARLAQERGWHVLVTGLMLLTGCISLWFLPLAYGMPALTPGQLDARAWLWQWKDPACCNWASSLPPQMP